MMFMVVLVGCIGAYYQRGAVASAAVISYMAGVPSNKWADRRAGCGAKALCVLLRQASGHIFHIFPLFTPTWLLKCSFMLGVSLSEV
jgi:hypothetical protein